MSDIDAKALVQTPVSAKSKRPRYSLNKNKYLLDPEAEKLEYLLKSHLAKDSRNCALLFLALHTGARAQELLNIRKEDLNSYEESIYIRGLKGSNDRELPVPTWLFRELQALSLDSGAGIHPLAATRLGNPQHVEHLFPVTYNRLRQIWQIYRPVNKKLHCLRHTFAIRLYKKTRDLRLLQFALGHRNIANTMVYADYIFSQQELRRLLL